MNQFIFIDLLDFSNQLEILRLIDGSVLRFKFLPKTKESELVPKIINSNFFSLKKKLKLKSNYEIIFKHYMFGLLDEGKYDIVKGYRYNHNKVLDYSIRSNNYILFKLAIKNGANNWNDALAATCCLKPNKEMEKILLEKGANRCSFCSDILENEHGYNISYKRSKTTRYYGNHDFYLSCDSESE